MWETITCRWRRTATEENDQKDQSVDDAASDEQADNQEHHGQCQGKFSQFVYAVAAHHKPLEFFFHAKGASFIIFS